MILFLFINCLSKVGDGGASASCGTCLCVDIYFLLNAYKTSPILINTTQCLIVGCYASSSSQNENFEF